MKYIIMFFIMILGLSGCMSNTQLESTQKKHFLALMDIGYQWEGKIYYRNKVNIKTCVYHSKPSQRSKSIVDDFYTMMSHEFKVFNLPIYKNILNECPIDTDIYIRFNNGKMEKELLNISASNVFSRHNLIFESSFFSSSLGLAYIISDNSGDRIISFVAINQVMENTKYDTAYLEPTIIEELYQAISLGRDLEIKKNPMSELHENWSQLNYTLPYKFAKYKNYNSVGLCGFDLWYLILIYGSREESISNKGYSPMFLKNYDAIKKRALKIEKNPTYKNLLDPRCSGENTGINTKIGVQ